VTFALYMLRQLLRLLLQCGHPRLQPLVLRTRQGLHDVLRSMLLWHR
jgi:hypothetical protein